MRAEDFLSEAADAVESTPSAAEFLSSKPEAQRELDKQRKALQAEKVSDQFSGFEKFVARAGAGVQKAGINAGRMLTAANDVLFLPEITGLFSQRAGDAYRQAVDRDLAYWKKREDETTRDVQAIDDNSIIGQVVEGTARAIPEMIPQIIPGMAAGTVAGAVKASAITGGAYGGMSQYGQDRSEGRSRSEAIPYAVTSGLITALTTKAFGATGVESVFKKDGVQGIGAKLLNVLKEAGMEGAEEAVDQFQQDLLERAQRNPEKPIGDSIKDVLMAGTIGSLVGGLASGAHTALTAESKPSEFQKALEEGFSSAKNRTGGKRYADAIAFLNQTPRTLGEAADEAQARQENESLVNLIMGGRKNENPPSNVPESTEGASPVQAPLVAEENQAGKPQGVPIAPQTTAGVGQPKGAGEKLTADVIFARPRGQTTQDDIAILDDDEARKLFTARDEQGPRYSPQVDSAVWGASQDESVLKELEFLEKSSQDRATEMMRKQMEYLKKEQPVPPELNTAFLAASGKALWYRAAMEGVKKSGPNYQEAVNRGLIPKPKEAANPVVPTANPNGEQPPAPVAPAPVPAVAQVLPQPASPVVPQEPPKPVAPAKRTAVVGTGKPNGARAEVEYEVIEANELRPLIVQTISDDQTRQRTGNRASEEQITKIATAPDILQLSESPVSTIGAPIVNDVVVAGNGRASGLIRGYDGSTKGILEYRRSVVEEAARLGLGDVSNFVNPILIRRVKRYTRGTQRDFVVESNPKYGALQETVSERALLDAEALGDVSNLEFTATGKLSAASLRDVVNRFESRQRGVTRNEMGEADENEANRRVQLASLAVLAKEGNVEINRFIALVNFDEGKRVMGEIVRALPRLTNLDADLRMGGFLLEALRELQQGIIATTGDVRAYNSLSEWLAERSNELVKPNINPAADAILQMMVAGQKKPTVLRDFFNNYLTLAENEQAQRTEAKQSADIFGQPRSQVSGEAILNRIPRPEENIGKSGNAGAPANQGAAQPEVAAAERVRKYNEAWKKWQDAVDAATTTEALDAALEGASQDPERSTETYSDIQARVAEKKRKLASDAADAAEAARLAEIEKLPPAERKAAYEAEIQRIYNGNLQRSDNTGEAQRWTDDDERVKELRAKIAALPTAPAATNPKAAEAPKEWSVGSKVQIKAEGPTLWTIVEETTDPKFPDERIFKIQNDKTGKTGEYDMASLKPAKARTVEERESTKEKTKEELQNELLKLNPALRNSIKEFKTKAQLRDQIKREKAKRGPVADLGAGLPDGTGWTVDGVIAAVENEDLAGFNLNVITKDQAAEVTGRDEARGYGGFFYNGQVYLVADNIRAGNAESAKQILREEVAHGLLRTEEGLALLRQALNEGKLRLTKSERDALLAKGYKNEGNQLLDEFIAKSARENTKWWQDIVLAIKAFLSRAGLKLSNEDAARILLKQIRSKQPTPAENQIEAAIPASGSDSLSAEEIKRINRELNKLNAKATKTAQDTARIAELEAQLGQQDLFAAPVVERAGVNQQQRDEIARRQSRRLIAGQIEDQGGLFAPRGEEKQGDMFAAPPAPKTETPPKRIETGRAQPMDLFGDLAPSGADNPEFIRAQVGGVRGVGQVREVENIAEIRAAIKERVFNATPAVTDERTEDAWRIANELTDEVAKAGHALRYRNEIGGQEMGLPLLQNELFRYGFKLASSGDETFLRFMLDSSADFQTITGGGRTTSGRVQRAARELSDSPAFAWLQETMGRERAAAVEAGARVLPQETFLQLVRDMENLQLNPDELESFLNRARDAQGNGFADIVAEATAQGQAPQQPGVPRQPRQRGAQSPALPGMEQETDEEAENAAQNTANRILEQLQIRHAGVEWLRPDANLDAVREIVRISLRGRLGYAETDPTIDPILDDPTRIIEKIQQALENVGVETETARALGREIESERQNRWANRRVRQIERAARSNSVRSLIEDILNTPYRAQHDPAWRRQMAIRWFESNGLSREQATAAADMFNREFEAAYQRAAEKVAARVLRDGAPKTNEQFERLIRSGVLDPSKPWLDKFAEASGWVKPTPEQFQKIAELEEKLADPALSPSEVADIIEQQRTILRHVGKKDGAAMRAMGESFTASLLSQAVSFGRTFWVQFAPVFSILKDFSTAVAFDPKNALNFASALVTAYKKQGKSQLKFGWQKDAFQFHINDITGSHNELQRVYEETRRLVSSPTVSRSRKAVAVVQQVYAFQRFVFRVMNTIDNMQMSIGREWKIVYYSSLAFKDAGINSPQKISELIDAMNSIRQSEFDRARDAGLDEATANVRADHRATQAALDFVSKEAGSDYAMKVLQAAENDAYNVVGRRSPGIGPKDEGMISNYGPNQLMEFASNLRKQGGVGNIVATMSVGMINIPLRAARAATDLHGYGLIRYGIWKYRNNRGLENHWKQSFANELQAKHRRNVAITGLVTAVVTGLLASSTADDDANDKDKNGLFVTGSGPKSKNLRDEWIKNGWSPYTLHVVISGVKAAKIPLTRVGEPLYPAFMMAGVRDNVEWAKKDAVAKGKEINVASVYAQNLIAAHAQLLGARGLFQSVNQFGNLTEGGGGLEKNLARMIGGTAAAIVIPFKSALSQISEMVTGPLDNSSAEAILKNQVPNFGLWSKPAVNRFGDALYNQTLSGKLERLGIPFTLQIPSDSTNDKLYGTLINKGIAPPELRRYVLEEKFGDLTDDQFSDFARKSGALLKQSAVSNLNDIQRMSPTEAKRFLQNAAERADKTAAAALGLERREKPQAATTTSPAASAPAPAASATSSASTSTGGGGSSRASASGRIRKSLASFKVPRLKKAGGRIRSRISRGFKRIKAKTGRIRGRISYRRRMPRIRYAI